MPAPAKRVARKPQPSAVELAAIALTLGLTLEARGVVTVRLVGDDDSVAFRLDTPDGPDVGREDWDEFSNPLGPFYHGWERRVHRDIDVSAFGAAKRFVRLVGVDVARRAVRAAREAHCG
ncbi:MAG: hypothetical protein HOW73_20315 [Polyangiaceae bacterium]|nr:hypothetical protein [Polyangiaceae bacterium]